MMKLRYPYFPIYNDNENIEFLIYNNIEIIISNFYI